MLVPIYPYHVNDVVSIKVDRGVGGVPLPKNELVSAPSAGVSNVRITKSVLPLVRNKERLREMRPFDLGPLPPSVYLVDTDVIHVINDTRPSPSVFAYCKSWTVGRSGNEATYPHVLTFTALTPPNKLSQVEYSKSML